MEEIHFATCCVVQNLTPTVCSLYSCFSWSLGTFSCSTCDWVDSVDVVRVNVDVDVGIGDVCVGVDVSDNVAIGTATPSDCSNS